MRRVIVRVLPVPAPASTHTGPRAARTASRCSSSRSPMSSSRDVAASTDMRYILAGHCDKSRARRGHVGGIRYVRCLMSAVTMYTTSWCGFCFRLKKGLKGGGISLKRGEVEADPAAAEFVASVNGGNQTVPTLKFADGSTLTNPSGFEVRAKLAGGHPPPGA